MIKRFCDFCEISTLDRANGAVAQLRIKDNNNEVVTLVIYAARDNKERVDICRDCLLKSLGTLATTKEGETE